MMHLRFIFSALIVGLAFIASAKVTFQLMPRQNVVSGTNFHVVFRLTVEDESLGNISLPKAPELEGCKLLSGPNQTTSQRYTQIINGRESSSAMIDLACVYRAGEPGKVTIPPVTINIAGRAYTSAGGSFEILPPDASSPQPANVSGSGQPASSASSQSGLSEYFVRVIFSKPTVYEQEGVIATTKLYRPANNRTGIQLEAIPKMPVYEGFLSEDLKPNPEGQIENYNGKNYYTYELSRVLLFPQKAGTLKVTSGTYTLKIQEVVGQIRMSFWSTPRYEEYSYTTPLTTGTITVKPLPEPRPADFCGAVGHYSLTATLSPDILRTNESSTYSLTFKGTGNVKYLTVPTVEFPATFDKYTPKSDIHASVTGQTYTGTYTVDYPLVPQEVGKFEIAAQTFSYFDLSSQKYVQLETPAFDTNVQRGAAVAVSTEQRQIDTSMTDILHIRPLPEFLRAAPVPVIAKWWFWTLWALALAFLVTAFFAYRRQIRLNADVAGRRNARASRVVAKRFKAAYRFMKAHDSDKFYDELAQALKGYIGDKFGLQPSALISDAIVAKLTQYKAPQDIIDDVLAVLDDCEMARFTPSQSDAAMNELYNKATNAIKSIENIKSR